MTNLLGSIRLAAYAFPLIAALVAVPFFDRQVRACCFNWVRTVFGGLFLFYVLCVLSLVFFPLPDSAQAARLSGHTQNAALRHRPEGCSCGVIPR